MRVLIQVVLMLGLAQSHAYAELVDPTKPPPAVLEYLPNAESQVEKPWELSALQHNGKSGFAVVNGQMVQVGESYNGFKLTSVNNQQAVFISKTGEKKVIGLGLTSYIVEARPQVKTKAKTTRQTGKVKK
ncbi:hypothetical protein [Methylophilus sp.]|uniref:hypothetical protein n=1 Tax=Methylophilus sp. TaxID=29541 RepID=UPI0040372EC7